jgi:hypothetical protein
VADTKQQVTSAEMWDRAIADAERGIKRLKLAILTCREKKEAGEPWPSDEDELTKPEVCHR